MSKSIGRTTLFFVALGAFAFACGMLLLGLDMQFTEAKSFSEFLKTDVSLQTKIVMPLILVFWAIALVVELRRFAYFLNYKRPRREGDIFG